MSDDAPRGEPGAVLRPDKAAPLMDVSRYRPRESLRDFVDYHWIVRWRIEREHRQQVLPQPKIHLAAEIVASEHRSEERARSGANDGSPPSTTAEIVASEHRSEERARSGANDGSPPFGNENGRLLVHGISREPFFRRFTTSGQVIGVAFKPGGFRPFLRSSVGALEGRVVPAGELWGADDRRVADFVLTTSDDAEMVRAVEDYLDALAPEQDPLVAEVGAIVARIESDTTIHRVDQVARFAHTTPRTLQRLFTDYVGISPKWVIQRRRLIDAAERAHNGPVVWSELADQLGFSDQAHLIRAWTAAVGTPPATYVRETRGWRPRA